MDSRHSNDEFNSKISNRSCPRQTVITQSLLEILPKIAGSSSSNCFSEFYLAQKVNSEPRVSQTLPTSAFVADKYTAIQCKFIRRREFGYNVCDEIDNNNKKTRQ